MTEQVKNLMKALDITEAEALEIIEADRQIEQGEKLFELTEEQKANSKKARQTGTRTQKAPTKRERKEDADKRFLIDILGETLWGHGAEFTVATNPDRQIDFEFNGRKFRVVLSAPRT